MKFALLVLLAVSALPLHAAELFGIRLQDAKRDELRSAVKKSGIELIREGGQSAFFDTYDSRELLAGSTHLYLGFVKQDQSFAFAEYSFNGLKQPRLLDKLVARYGKPQQKQGKFLSDHSYLWRSGSITIAVDYDWHNYRTRLTYYDPEKLGLLRREQGDYRKQFGPEDVDFVDQAY